MHTDVQMLIFEVLFCTIVILLINPFSSSLILRVMCDAHSAGIKFRVIVVDGRPKLEGKKFFFLNYN